MAGVFIETLYTLSTPTAPLPFTGEFRMEKVKVTRYMPGRRPDYAPDTLDTSSSSSDSEGEGQVGVVRDRRDELHEQHREYDEREVSKDRRLERLRERATHVDR